VQLWQVLADIPNVRLTGDPATGVRGLAYDSGRVEPGDLFAALRGTKRDGNDFVDQAIGRGASAVLSSGPPRPRLAVAWAQVDDDRLGLALAARNYYGRPDENLTMVGVTGTNGKTTTCFLIESILREADMKPCLIGTVLYRYQREEMKADRTTPESLDLYRLLDRFATAGARSCAMEVSSHSLALRRVAGLRFRAAVFTNLTQDHLDFHGTMEAYLEAKALLFASLPRDGVAILNADDPASARLRVATSARVITWGTAPGAGVRLASMQTSTRGTVCDLEVAADIDGRGTAAVRLRIDSPLLGRPNALNLTAAAAAALALGLPARVIVAGLEAVPGVTGRFERVEAGQPFTVLVDYAHTDDALASLLAAVRDLKPRRILTVFGCGGDRDRAKRPKMGYAAARGSDLVIVTSDNPRGEDPETIIREILPGVREALGVAAGQEPDPARCLVIADRKEAIRRAMTLAADGDCVVIAGKGHETYQILRDRTVPFDDREAARDVLRTVARGRHHRAAR
jgi:UDP-N-acetylmuramoyl-L-alanyl-D-glutamate--2,6-diaminopimelate ligase